MSWSFFTQKKLKSYLSIVSLVGGVITGAFVFKATQSFSTRSPASDSPSSSPSFNYESLVQIFQNKHPQSIDELLPLLPEEFRDNYTIVYRSRSTLQEATEADPRIIMYNGTDAKLLMSFNGNPKEKGYNELEVIQYRDQSQAFELYQVELPYSATQAPQKNPTACLTCHGDHPRPNWDGYFVWPGLIGAHDGDVIGRDVAREAAMDWNHGRYKFIKAGGSVEEPNSNLSTLLGLLNGQRIAKLIKDNSTLYPYRYAILGATVCSDGRFEMGQFLPPAAAQAMGTPYAAILADTIQKNRNYFHQRVLQLDADLSPPGGPSALIGKRATRPEYQDHGPEFTEQIARFRYVIEGLGVSMERWNMPFDLNTYSFNDGAISVMNPNWWVPLFSSADDASTLADLQNNSEKILDYFESLDSNHPNPAPAEYLNFCGNLSKKSLTALAQVAPPVSASPVPSGTGLPPVVQLCMGCHVGTAQIAPAIPFDQPKALKDWLSTQLPDGTTNLDLLLNKISNSPKTGSRMPPFRALAPQERADLLQFIGVQ
jgi:hypothetical protein